MHLRFPNVMLVFCLSILASPAMATRDGKSFDQGAGMTARATGAPEQLDRLVFMPGHWEVNYQEWQDDSLAVDSEGRAEITYMNRGHGLMERYYMEVYGENDLATVSFIVCDKSGIWAMGVANSFTESIAVHSGDFEGDALVLYNAIRHKGGSQLILYRTTVTRKNDDAFSIETAISTDMGKNWSRKILRTYSRRRSSPDFLTPESTYGEPAPGLPEEARQFDFLIGQWSNKNDITFANGRRVTFTTNATAVYALNGHAVMEFNWFDTDPNLPDAATSILRVYNRQMRRWECMYTTNRFNSILYFGGVMEGDRIVLHLFGADASDSPVNQWVFHDWKEDSYGWYGNTSRDRGRTWKKTWIIEATRKSDTQKPAGRP